MKYEKKSARSNFGFRGWIMVVYAFLVCFTGTAIPQMFNSTGDYYTGVYGWSMVTLQGFLTIGGLLCTLTMLLVGKLSLKISVRKMAIISCVAMAILNFCFGFVKELWVMGLLCIVIYQFTDTNSFMFNGIMIANWFPKKSGLAMGWVTFGFPLAASFGTLIMITALIKGGIVAAYIPFSVLALVCAALCAIFLKDYPEQCGCFPDNDKTIVRDLSKIGEQAALEEMMQDNSWTTKRTLADADFWLISMSIGLMMFASGFMTQVGAALGSMNFDMNLLIPIMMGIGIVSCIGSYVCGVLDMKLGTKKAVIVTDAVLLLMAILAQFNNIVCLFIAFACMGVVMGGGSNYLVSWINNIWGRNRFKSIFRWSQPITNIWATVAMFIIAWVAEMFGGYKASFVLAGILAAISIILAALVKEDRVAKKITKFSEA